MVLSARLRSVVPAAWRGRTIDYNWVILLGLTLPAWAPLTYPGFVQVHQGFLPIYQLHDLAAHPAWGWLPTVGQPADLWRGAGPLPYLLSWPLLPLGGLTAIKVLLALALIVGPLALYGVLRRWWGTGPALVAALLYAYLPFNLTNVYVRGAYTEAVLWALAPLLLWWGDLGGERGRGWGWPIAAAVVAAAMVWVQAGLALVVAPVVVLALWLARPAVAGRALTAQRRPWWPLIILLGAVVGLGLRLAWNGSQAASVVDFMAHRVELFQLFAVGQGFGVSAPGWQDTLSFQVGLAAAGIALLAVLPPPAGPQRRPLVFWGLIVLLAVLGALLPLPLGGLLTYPWQVLGLAGLGLCILAAAGLARYPALTHWPALSALAATAVLAGYAYLAPHYTAVQPGAAPVAIFGGYDRGIVLIDDTTRGTLTPGSVISTTLTWQALQSPDFDYNLFLHLVDDRGQRWGQTDQQPAGERPMTGWAVGEVITGTVGLTVDPATPSGTPLRLVLGLYNWQTGQRLPADAGDQVTVVEGVVGQ